MISFCITNWNRFELTIDCFKEIIDDERIGEFVISDDASTDGSYEKLVNHFAGNKKVKIFRNETNKDCYFNKKIAVELASNKWVILADSDNTFSTFYIDRIFDYIWAEDTILTPSFAYPHFNFERYSYQTISKENVAKSIELPMFEVMLNAANFFVNRQAYLDVWDGSVDPVTSDSIWFTYKWLESGRKIFVVPHLTYFHRIHSGSHYQKNVARTPDGFHQSVLDKIKQLQ